MSDKGKTRYETPLEIVHANNRARFATISGGICAILLVVLELLDADWWPMMIAALTVVTQLGRACHQRGYASGYRRGLEAGKTWLDVLPRLATGRRSGVS